MAKKPIIDEKFKSSGPAAIKAPTIITLDIALVTAIQWRVQGRGYSPNYIVTNDTC